MIALAGISLVGLPMGGDVDGITIAFEEGSLTTLKIVIGAILFGIALDTTFEDFRRASPTSGRDRDRGRRPVRAAARRSPSC